MNSKRHLLKDVIKNRRLGFSFSYLSKKYGISKSTVSLWCKNIKLSSKSKNLIREKWLLSTASARKKGTLKNKQKRLDSINSEYLNAKKMIEKLNNRDMLIMGVGLYWAEGSKKETGSGFSFVNSDHLMIKLMYDWLLNIIGVKKKELIINLSINISHKEREVEILSFWSNLLDFPMKYFGNTVFIKTPHKRLYDNHINYYGMLRIKVRSSSWLRRRILGMIKISTENTPV